MPLSRINTTIETEVIELLKFWKLPYSDLSNMRVQIYCLKDESGLKGTGGLEIYGENALIRSVAVAERFLRTGQGKIICDELEQIALKSGIKNLYLLTTTAASFFKHRGYETIEREQFPEGLKNTAQFSELCPSTAICMKKILQ